MSATATNLDRNELLRELGEVERRRFELRQLLSQTTALKKFFHYRCHPEQHVFAYAETEQEARQNVIARMNRSYGPDGWRFAIETVEALTPERACSMSPGNLLASIPEGEARQFIDDWEADKAGREEDPRPEHTGLSAVEKDVEDFKIRLRMKEQKR